MTSYIGTNKIPEQWSLNYNEYESQAMWQDDKFEKLTTWWCALRCKSLSIILLHTTFKAVVEEKFIMRLFGTLLKKLLRVKFKIDGIHWMPIESFLELPRKLFFWHKKKLWNISSSSPLLLFFILSSPRKKNEKHSAAF